VNDDNKDPNSKLAGSPNASSDADENPWDDDGGGRTLATDGPSFELPSNIPSPITVPPPPAPAPPPMAVKIPGPVRPRSPTMMGFGPMGPPLPSAAPASAPGRPIVAVPPPVAKPGVPPASARGVPAAPRVAAPAPQRPAAPAAPARPAPAVPAAPATAPLLDSEAPAKLDDVWDDDDDSNRDDGPTMMGAALTPDVPLRDDVVNPRHSPLASTAFASGGRFDKEADTVALEGDHEDLPPIGAPVDAEETTRAVSREELMGHQDVAAHVVLGDDDDAHGDEATLAVAPGALADLGINPGLAASLSERQPRQPMPGELPGPPVFPPPPGPPQAPPPMSYGSQGAMAAQPPQSHPQPQVQSWQGEAAQQPSWQGEAAQPPSWQGEGSQSYRNPMGGMAMQQGYDPMLQQGHQSSPGMQNAQPQQGYPMQGGPGQQSYGQNGPMMGGPQMQQMPQPQWMQSAPNGSGGGLAQKFTPQVIMLVVVGAVCLSIFIIGIVLFVTTNFQHP
jgi:hypothetical protein